MPGSDSRKPEYLKMNPSGTVPVMTDGDVVIWESGAILQYLSDKYGWEDLYPKNIAERAQIDNWLHWHHRNSREVQIAWGMPVMRPDLVKAGLWAKSSVMNAKKALFVMNQVLENQDFLALNRLTLADIQCSQDIIQMREKYMDTLDFSKYPNIVAWMDRLENGPGGEWLQKKLTKVGKWIKGVKAKRAAKEAKKRAKL